MIRKFKTAVEINKKENENGTYYYFDMEIDFKKTVRVWISKEMLNIIEDRYGKLYIEFPIKGDIVKGKKPNSLILKKGSKNVFYINTDQKEGSMEIKNVKSKNLNIVAQRVILDDVEAILATTEEDELILDWEYIYHKRKHRHVITGIFKMNTNKEKLLLENITIELLNEVIKEV